MLALDLTPAFDELLKKNEGRPTAKPAFDPEKTEGFLKEAYRINGHIVTLARQLRDVRQAYLSTAPPRRVSHQHGKDSSSSGSLRKKLPPAVTSLTDAQREDVDANAKRLLRDLDASIRGLAEAEALHQETQQALLRKTHGGSGGKDGDGAATVRLPRFVGGGVLSLVTAQPKSPAYAAAEEAQRQAAAHRESILWYLRQRLQACGRAQQMMMEARLARMVETGGPLMSMGMGMGMGGAMGRGRAVSLGRLAAGAGPATGTTAAAATAAAMEETTSTIAPAAQDDGLTQEQLQLFERGNQEMVKHYETTLDKVRAAEQSLVEISELQTMLVSNLEVQAAHVDQMVTDAENTADNVAKGNDELKKALARPSTARYTFYAAGGLCLFVVVWDFFV